MKMYNDCTPLNLTNEEIGKVLKSINESVSNLMFFRDLIQSDSMDGQITKNDVWTHLGLNESYHAELSKQVGYDSILATERDNRHKEIRQKNQEIKRLIEQRGKEVTPEAVAGALRRYRDILDAWYENEGFRYASIEKTTIYGITAELTSEMEIKKDPPSKNSEIKKTLWTKDTGTIQKIENGWDIQSGRYIAELLDTNNNKENITNLIRNAFPKSRILSFQSRINDHSSFSLRTTFNVPYSDLDLYYKNRSSVINV